LVGVFGMLQDMYDGGYFMNGTATIDLPTAEAAFANNQVAMLYDGSWVINVLKSLMDNMDMDDYGVAMPPKAPGTDRYPAIAGGAGAYLVASGMQDSAHLAASVEFLKFITNKENQIAYANESSNIPANSLALDKSSLNPLLISFYVGMDYLQPPSVGMKPRAIGEYYDNALRAVCIGSMTAEQAVAQLDADRAAMPPDVD
jgi:ABC-type glycerol-3-phosphate transport system substrate-binding protein